MFFVSNKDEDAVPLRSGPRWGTLHTYTQLFQVIQPFPMRRHSRESLGGQSFGARGIWIVFPTAQGLKLKCPWENN